MKDLDNLRGHLALDSQAELRYNACADTVRMIGQADPIFFSSMCDTEEAVNRYLEDINASSREVDWYLFLYPRNPTKAHVQEEQT